MNAKIIASATALIALVASFYYYGEYRAQIVRTEYEAYAAKATQEALKKQGEIQEAANELAYQLHQNNLHGQERLSELRGRLDRLPVSHDDCTCLDTDSVVRLLDEANSDPALPPSTNPPYLVGEGNPVEGYCLEAIAELNRVKNKVNTLINVVQ